MNTFQDHLNKELNKQTYKKLCEKCFTRLLPAVLFIHKQAEKIEYVQYVLVSDFCRL